MKNSIKILCLVALFSLLLASCNMPGQSTPTSQVDLLNTAAAQTIQVQQTAIAQTNAAVVQPTATLTPEPSNTETAAPTDKPTSTPTAQTECNQIAFIEETIPDGTTFVPGQTFTKTWTVRNAGSCTWNRDYDLVFVSGDAMSAPASQQLTNGSVAPGQSVEISIDLKAPNSAGSHKGNFKLRDASGVLFGVGTKDGPFWVEIMVTGDTYNFADNYCAPGVTWTTAAGTLPCPGSSGSGDGWVLLDSNPELENGAVDDEDGIVVHPQNVNDGWIKGTFPEILVKAGTDFQAIIGCNSDANCDVKFQLNYKINGGSEQTLATWHEVQDGAFNRVIVDLDSLAGKEVQFILLVSANGSAANDTALWFAPRIQP
jgi:hypothetical protein